MPINFLVFRHLHEIGVMKQKPFAPQYYCSVEFFLFRFFGGGRDVHSMSCQNQSSIVSFSLLVFLSFSWSFLRSLLFLLSLCLFSLSLSSLVSVIFIDSNSGDLVIPGSMLIEGKES